MTPAVQPSTTTPPSTAPWLRERLATVPAVPLCGMELSALGGEQCIDLILDALDAGCGGWVITPNVEIARRVSADPALRELVARADVRMADGIMLVWATQLAGTPVPERVCGSDLIYSLTEAAAGRDRSVFFLGGDEGVAAAAAETLCARYAGLRVAGVHCPPMGFEQDPDEMERVVAALRAAQPDIIYVALGFPKAERLIDQLRATLPRAWWMGVGISFSYVSGEIKRAPVWMQKVGLESAVRLAQEPRRLAKRYLLVGPPFAARVLLGAAVRGLRGRRSRRG